MTAGATIRRLNWGCGREGASGWINADQRAGPGIDLVGDIRAGLPLDDDSLDYIASIHALQEVPLPDLVSVLREFRRVLKPCGRLRLVVPDLDRAIRAYLAEDRGYFMVPDEHTYCLGGKFITQIVWYGYTRTPLTYDYLEELLVAAGFRRVERCAYRQSCGQEAGIVDLDNRERESLFVEAVK